MSAISNSSDKTEDDWREATAEMSTGERYLYLLEHEILTDCTLVVGPEDGETREFKAHRFLLCNASAVFEKMLMNTSTAGHVRVTDLSPRTFDLLLRFIYAGEYRIVTFDEARDLAFAADKYRLKQLFESVVASLCGLVTHANVWSVLELAKLGERTPQLRQACIEVLRRDTVAILSDESLMRASEENVALLLEQHELNVENELDLVNISVHWARHEARRRGLADDDEGVRAVLKPRLLRLVRFLALTYHQFVFGPGLAGWLTNKEKSAIEFCLQSKNFSRMPSHLSVAEPRNVVVTMPVAKPRNVVFLGHMERNKMRPPRKLASTGVEHKEIKIERYY